MKYSQSQLEAVIELQELHQVPGRLSLEACEQYLDWHRATCTSSARNINSTERARADGMSQGLSIHEQQFRKLSELARR